MAVMDAQALITDPGGLAFLADVLGTSLGSAQPPLRFPMEAWSPAPRRDDAASRLDGLSRVEPQLAPAE